MCKRSTSSIEKHREDMRLFKEKMLKAGPEECKDFLMSTGVYNEDGTLKDEYK